MCNLYNLTIGPQAIREFTRAVLDEVGNLEPGKVYPDYSAPIVRNGEGGRRELVRAVGNADAAQVHQGQCRQRRDQCPERVLATLAALAGRREPLRGAGDGVFGIRPGPRP